MEILNPANGSSAMHAPQFVQSEWCAISTITEGCTHFCLWEERKAQLQPFLSFILLGSLTIPLRRRIGKSDHRQARVLSPLRVFLWEKPWDFAFTFLEEKSQSSWSRKVRLQGSARRICDHNSNRMDRKIWWTSSLSECSPMSSSCAWNSGFTFLDEKTQSSWPSTMHASQFVHDSGYKTVLTIKKNARLSLATENTEWLQSFWSLIWSSYSDLWSHGTPLRSMIENRPPP
jgi:hypothetical protein